jgi:hypothetical protein
LIQDLPDLVFSPGTQNSFGGHFELPGHSHAIFISDDEK